MANEPNSEAREVEILPPDPEWQSPREPVRVYEVIDEPDNDGPARVKTQRQGDASIVARWAKWALRLYLLAVGSMLVVWLFEPFGPDLLRRVTTWLAALGLFGKALIVAGVAIGCPLFLPVGPLAVVPGYLYGAMEGTLLAIAGAALGGVINFYLARWYLEPHVHAWLDKNPVPASLFRTIDARGVRIALGLRVTPIMHYGVLSFLCGLTTMRWWQFVAAMAVGGLPWTSVWASVGEMLHEALRPISLGALDTNPYAWPMRWGGLIVLVVLAVWVGRVARRDLAQAAGAAQPPTGRNG